MIEITQCQVPRGGDVIGFAVTEVGYRGATSKRRSFPRQIVQRTSEGGDSGAPLISRLASVADLLLTDRPASSAPAYGA